MQKMYLRFSSRTGGFIKLMLLLVVMGSGGKGLGQINEGFESGLPTSYTATTTYTLGSGTWTGQANGVIRGTLGVHTGSYSLQLRPQTASQVTTPNITVGVSTISFWASSSTAGGSLQVNISTDGGFSFTGVTGSPFSLNTTVTPFIATVNNLSPNILIQFYRTASTVYIDDVAIGVPICSNPTINTQPSNQSVDVSNSATFSLAASGTFSTYQWQVDDGLGGGFVHVSTGTGSTTNTYNTGATTTALNGNDYRCIVYSGTCSTTSNSASLSVNCTSTHTVTGFIPTAGPSNTVVTITGTGFTGATAVKFGAIDAASYTVINSTTIVARTPTNAPSGLINVTNSGCSINAGTNFSGTASSSGTCSAPLPSDLFISEVYDAAAGTLSYIELYNGTLSTINLSSYSIKTTIDGNTVNTLALTGTIASGGVVIVKVGNDGSSTDCPGHTSITNSSSTCGFNGNDVTELVKSGTVIDRVENPNYGG